MGSKEFFEAGEVWLAHLNKPTDQQRLYKVVEVKDFDYQGPYYTVHTFRATLERINGNKRVIGVQHQRLWNETEGYSKVS